MEQHLWSTEEKNLSSENFISQKISFKSDKIWDNLLEPNVHYKKKMLKELLWAEGKWYKMDLHRGMVNICINIRDFFIYVSP